MANIFRLEDTSARAHIADRAAIDLQTLLPGQAGKEQRYYVNRDIGQILPEVRECLKTDATGRALTLLRTSMDSLRRTGETLDRGTRQELAEVARITAQKALRESSEKEKTNLEKLFMKWEKDLRKA